MKFKFQLEDNVKLPDGRHGLVKKVLFDSDSGVRYQVSMNSVDFKTNEIVSGHITVAEEDLEKYETQ